jgi:diguanylate cyclase (GGDEF)-like protein/PAS domain S-box-containing protein
VKQGRIAAAAAVSAVIGLHFLGFSPWSAQPQSTVNFAAVVLALGVSVFLNPARAAADAGGTTRLSFVSDCVTLLFFGPIAMTLGATIGVLARTLSNPPRAQRIRRVLLDVVTVAAATQAAGLAHAVLGGSSVPLAWPWQAIPIAAAVLAFCVITSAVADLIAPLATGGDGVHAWPRHALRGVPGHVIAAAIAVAVTELVDHHAWSVLPVAAVPLCLAWIAYQSNAERQGEQERRLDVLGSPGHGVCVVDDSGIVLRWNDALAAFLDCPSSRALRRQIAQAVPAVGQSALPAAVLDVISTRTARTLSHVPFWSAASSRVFAITIVPDSDGALLIWTDVTADAAAGQALRETAERFALIAAGTHDGVWELDDTTRALFVSARWRELVGLAPGDNWIPCEAWFDRVHAEDLDTLRRGLELLAAGKTNRLEQQHRICRDDGSYRTMLCRCVGARNGAAGATKIAGSLTDVTESALALQKIHNAGFRDFLTGLLSRAAFVERLGQRLDEYRAHRSGPFAALYLDLDRFKVVNDSLGHLIGDELLVSVSRRLESCLRPGDAIARLGGDEFAVMLQSVRDATQANVVAFRLQEVLQAPFPVGGRDVVTSASIGIAISRAEYSNPEEMMRDADTAMYHAKAHGKACHELFDADMHARALDRLGLESDLRLAVKSSEFEVHYQPIVSLTTRMCTGFESLIRWNRHGKAVSPADFIPMAEELGIIEPLGTWVMQQACQKFVEWKQRFPESGLDCITVNVSARQLVQQGFVYLVEQTVERNHMKPADLRLEITETALMDAPHSAAVVLAELREFGVKIYLDDFGTGYSSLSHLHKLPVDALKIDRSFVRGLLMDDRPAMVESILALARALQTNVVAEGIEEERQAVELERLGCRQAQGFYFSRPVPAEKIEQMLAAGLPLGGPRTAAPQPALAVVPHALKARITA